MSNDVKKGSQKLYFKYLRSQNNEPDSYEYHAPIYGESNTDCSYYEPQSTRIANMKKSASGLSTGVYDFNNGETNKEIMDKIHDFAVPIGRKPGITFEEVTQVQTYNSESIISQSKNAEAEKEAAKTAKKETVQTAIDTAKAISSSSEK